MNYIFVRDAGMKPVGKKGHKARYWEVQCPLCLINRVTLAGGVKRTKSSTCGSCSKITHKETGTPLYIKWWTMKNRCAHNENYISKGINVCKSWETYENFRDWALVNGYAPELSIERVKVGLGYSPDNCTFIPMKDQAYNRGVSSRNSSGFIGISKYKRTEKWVAQVHAKGARLYNESFKTLEEAVVARDNFISENNLPHKLNRKKE